MGGRPVIDQIPGDRFALPSSSRTLGKTRLGLVGLVGPTVRSTPGFPWPGV